MLVAAGDTVGMPAAEAELPPPAASGLAAAGLAADARCSADAELVSAAAEAAVADGEDLGTVAAGVAAVAAPELFDAVPAVLVPGVAATLSGLVDVADTPTGDAAAADAAA